MSPLDKPLPDAARGKAVWRIRRRNAFERALRQSAAVTDLGVLVLSFFTISETLAQFIPAGTTSLPRGYAWTTNTEGEPAITRDAHYLTPGFGNDYPPLEVALQFAADLKSGWLDDLARSLGLEGASAFSEGIR